MRQLAAVLCIAGGCAARVANVEDQPLFAAGWGGPAPHVGIQLTGAGAAPDQQQRCVDALGRAGAVVDAQAPVRALLTLDPAGNRLQITSARRGLVRDEPRPSWSVERLCDDALYAMVGAIRQDAPTAEREGSPAEAAPSLSPVIRRAAAPSANGLDEQPDGPPSLPATSGGSYRGPIK